MSPIVISCVLNQSHEHWLFGDAPQFVITKAHEFCDHIVNLVVPNFMGDPEANALNKKLENSWSTRSAKH